MVKKEYYISKVMEDTGISREEIQHLVNEKQSELKGLISEEGALFIISKELGVDIMIKDQELPMLYIGNLQENMKNVIISGHISRIFDVHLFMKKDGSNGRVLNFIIQDKTGEIRVVMWDDKTDIVDDPNFEVERLVEIHKGYMKWSDYHNKLELHLSNWGKIIISEEKEEVIKKNE